MVTVSESAANGTFRKLYQDEWEWRVRQLADLTGLDILIAEDRPLFEYLPRASCESHQTRQQHLATIQRALGDIDRDSLSADERTNHDVYCVQIGDLLTREQYGEFEAPANSDTAFWSDLAAIARRRFGSPEDYERWIMQMRDVPRFFGEMIEVMRSGLRRGFTPPEITMRGRDASIKSVVEARPEDTPFFIPYRTAERLLPRSRSELRVAALRVIEEEVQPAYAGLLAFMRNEYLPGCRETLSAEALPNGKEYYRAKVRQCTTLDGTPEEIHAFGLTEVARLQGEMRQILRELKFAGSIADFLDFLRTDPRFYAKSADELLMRAAWVSKRVDGLVSRYFASLPRMRFAIRPVPGDIAPYYTAGRAAPGIFFLNTHQLESRPLFNLPALTLHEAEPGHVFQLALALENTTLPAFRRQTYLPAYAEGWALYCERLGEEMGLYESAYERFGMLGYQVWRAARLVVDTGIHALGWGRDRAITYLAETTSLSPHEVATEVDRYISCPAQALSYYLGANVIWKARIHAEQALGPMFDIKQFHDTILGLGSVPLTVLEASVNELILTSRKV